MGGGGRAECILSDLQIVHWIGLSGAPTLYHVDNLLTLVLRQCILILFII